MIRFRLLLLNEFRLFRTAIPFHLIAIVQPTLLFILMAYVMVSPTFNMRMQVTGHETELRLIRAMEQVGSPIGDPYIHLIPVEDDKVTDSQLIQIEDRNGVETAVQHFGSINSNMVKNYRNRLTAAGLVLWNEALGETAVSIRPFPWLSRDIPLTVYFGMAMLPMATFLGAALLGCILTAQDYEFHTILEYRLSPISPINILAGRLCRLILSGLLGAVLILIALGLMTGFWPNSFWVVVLILLPQAIIAGSVGITVGLWLKQSLPAFVIIFAVVFAGWILGGAFGLPSGFSGPYALISQFLPNSHTITLLFPHYYGVSVGAPVTAVFILLLMCVLTITLMVVTYQQQVIASQSW